MAYTQKFQDLAYAAGSRVEKVPCEDVDALIKNGAVALDIRDKEWHDAGYIEGVIPDLDTTILCYCNAYNRGAFSADTLRAMGYKNAKFIAGGVKAYRSMS